MTTLAIMKARIATELRRTNISTQIADAINTSIEAYKSEPLWFTQKYNVDITLNSGQEFYTGTDNAWIERIQRLDFVHLLMGTQAYTLTLVSQEWLDIASTSGSNGGQPYRVGYFAETLRFFPVPNASGMSARLTGKFEIPAPAGDAEASNPWMTDAEELIRCRAKYELFQHVLYDAVKAAIFDPARVGSPTDRALKQLRKRTAAKMHTGRVEAWSL